ncbi:MAG TPA: OmpA family protein [bacterium]|nr:OmpA family protein [bacterium]
MASVRTGRKPEEPPRGAASYMTTYGDMTTLLLIFFVFMFNVTTGVSEARVNAAISSFKQAMGVFPSSISVLRPDEVMLVPKEKGTKNYWGPEKQLEELEKRLRKEIKKMQNLGPGYLNTMRGQKELKVTIGSQAMFESGKADIIGEFQKSLDRIAIFIKENHLKVIVEGHTDDRPISTLQYPSNWELSVSRASRIIRYFNTQHGIPNNMLAASGYADTRPVATNETNEGRQKNRRIEIILTPTALTPKGAPESAVTIFGDGEF